MHGQTIIKYKGWWIPEKDKPGMKLIDKGFVSTKSLPYGCRYVRNFGRAIDVGTWIGDSTHYLSRNFQEVIGFEANPIIYKSCLKNIKSKKMENVILHHIGLSNTVGEKNFFVRQKSTNSAWLSDELPPNDVTTLDPIKIKTTTLDELNIKNVDFIKIDVDSHEGYVIKGAMNWLSENDVVIMIENKRASHNRQSINMTDPDTLLRYCGYRFCEQIDKADYIYKKVKKTHVPQNYNKP